jgi:hypothetical protein
MIYISDGSMPQKIYNKKPEFTIQGIHAAGFEKFFLLLLLPFKSKQ